MASEAALTHRVTADLERIRHTTGNAVWWLKVHGSEWQRAGVPDILICWRGHFVAVELKRPDGKTTPIQVRELELLAAAGATTAVCHTYEAWLGLLKRLEERDGSTTGRD